MVNTLDCACTVSQRGFFNVHKTYASFSASTKC